MRILVTGSAGFIGSAVVLRLLDRGDNVIGIDNHNAYYDPQLKEARLNRFFKNTNYSHHRIDIANREAIDQIFSNFKPQRVINLAAQAGVRYSIENPIAYIDSNILGFAHILEGCRNYGVDHLVYASSSSVYGANTKMPFSVHQSVNHPLSLYAASKKANELMAHSYSNLYNLPTTGLRFFTVYGPWGRPDMALFKFTKCIIEGKPIQIFNHGEHKRDFTYIDDVVEGIVKVLDRPAEANFQWSSDNPDPASSFAPWRIYNIGNNSPVNLMSYISALENFLGKTSIKEFLPIQDGDVPETFADISDFIQSFSFKPKIDIEEGVRNFVKWYLNYYGS